MATNTKIQWTDHTVNFWTGCKKVSPGCKFCYMYRDQERYKKDPTDVLRVRSATIAKTLREAKPGDKIFTCSWSDFFIEEADAWRADAWDIIRQHPQFIWQILTKRPERIAACLPPDWGEGGWHQVWLGVSVETHAELARVMSLPGGPSTKRLYKTFISYEPALGPLFGGSVVDNWALSKIDWLIVGGESGNDTGKYRYRPCALAWIEHTLSQCRSHGVPVYVKQLGTHLAKELGCKDRHGGDIAEWPAAIRVRQFPCTGTNCTSDGGMLSESCPTCGWSDDYHGSGDPYTDRRF